MGLAERSYMAAGPRRALSWTGAIIAANVVIFLLWQFQGMWKFLTTHAMVSASGVFEHWRIHTLLTSAFSHMDPGHLIFNMLFFWWFGRDLEDWYGPVRFAVLFVFSAFTASIAHVALQLALGPPWVPALGASGAIMGIMAVYAFRFPNQRMYVWGICPVKMRWLVPIYIAMDLLGVFTPGSRVAHAAHLGGALAGLVFYLWGRRIFPQVAGSLWRRLRSILHVRSAPQHRRSFSDAARVDELLEKISRRGLDALTDEERQFLSEYSRRLRRLH